MLNASRRRSFLRVRDERVCLASVFIQRSISQVRAVWEDWWKGEQLSLASHFRSDQISLAQRTKEISYGRKIRETSRADEAGEFDRLEKLRRDHRLGATTWIMMEDPTKWNDIEYSRRFQISDRNVTAIHTHLDVNQTTLRRRRTDSALFARETPSIYLQWFAGTRLPNDM